MKNLVPRRYRGVSVTDVNDLTTEGLRRHFLGLEAYRRTEYIVARAGAEAAVLRVAKASQEPLFSPIVEVEVLSAPTETALVTAPLVDTAVPTQMATAALDLAPGARCVVVRGRYEHVNFILDPAPLRLRLVEVVPPEPAKLLDQVQRVLHMAEDLPPVQILPEIFDLERIAAAHPAPRYLFPCRGSGAAEPGAVVAYLDERPPLADWILVGCARSREIYRHVYGQEPVCVEMCPRELALRAEPGGHAEEATLTKCCSLEEGVERDGRSVIVPWGASLAEVRLALGMLVAEAEPAWAPA